jgi:hypothetical protein
MNMKKRAEPTCGLPMAVLAACAMLLIGFGAQAFAASHFGLTGPNAASPAASGLPFPGSDGKWNAAGLEGAAHPASAAQPAPTPPSEVEVASPPGNEPEARRPVWQNVNRMLLVLVFFAAIVIVGIVAVVIIRNKRKLGNP